MNIIFIGDVVGRPGRTIVRRRLPTLRQELNADFIIANGENLAGGVGITLDKADEMFQAGVDVLTTGNHVWKKKEFVDYMSKSGDDRILRPANYPAGAPGKGYRIYDVNGLKLGILNVQGRIFMEAIDCPFKAAQNGVTELKAGGAVAVFVDFHAEATSEKRAMGHFLDGNVTAVIGTHTHIQTADEEILKRGTAYLTDAGMVGVNDSVIGVEIKPVLEKFQTMIPVRFGVPKTGDVVLSGVLIEVDSAGSAKNIRRIREIHKYEGKSET